MIVKVTAYVHAYKDYKGNAFYRIDSFKAPLTKFEATVCETEFAVTIPDNFNLDEEVRKANSEIIKVELEAAENRVANLKKQLAGEA